MTCIIGLAEDGRVYMGGDSRINHGSRIYTAPHGKLLRKGEFLIGTSGLVMTRNLIEYVFEPPARPDGISAEAYMVTEFVPALHDLTRKRELDFNESQALVGYRGQIYQIGCDFSVSANTQQLYTIGSGDDLALGAMLALAGKAPRERILRALEIAAECNDGCGPPFTVEML